MAASCVTSSNRCSNIAQLMVYGSGLLVGFPSTCVRTCGDGRALRVWVPISQVRRGMVSLPTMTACINHECGSWLSFCFDVDCCVTGEHSAHHSTKQAQARNLEAHRAVPIAGILLSETQQSALTACKCLDSLVGRGLQLLDLILLMQRSTRKAHARYQTYVMPGAI